MEHADLRRAWSARDIPSQSGRVAVVTGANGGLGFETALALTGAGAEVVIAARDADRGRAAVAPVVAAHPQAVVSFEALDLASLAGVDGFAARMADRHDSIDLLVNNAGATPP